MFCSGLLIALASGCSGVAAGRGQGTQVAFRCKVGCAYAEVVVTATLISVKRGSNSSSELAAATARFCAGGKQMAAAVIGAIVGAPEVTMR